MYAGLSPTGFFGLGTTNDLTSAPFVVSSIGNVGVGTTSPQAILDIYGTTTANSAILVPRATTATRPSTSVNGMIRYNTDLAQLEIYSSGAWAGVSTSASVSGSYLPLGGGTLSGAVAYPSGSSAAPAINFGDATTGIYSTGSGNLSFATSSSPRVTITAAGNVGIGTTNPLSNAAYNWLTIGGASTSGIISLYGSGAEAFRLQATPLSTSLSAINGNPLLFSMSGSEAMRISGLGNVGIGTANPVYSLDVYSTNPATTSVARSYLSPTLTADSSNSYYTQINLASSNNSYNVNGNLYGVLNRAQSGTSSSGSINALMGSQSDVYVLAGSTSNIAAANGSTSAVINQASATVATARSAQFVISNTGSGNITNAYGVVVSAPNNTGSGAIGSYYGVYIATPLAASSNYSIYSQDGTNYFGGNVGVGTASPQALLDVFGTTNANSAILLPRATIANRPSTSVAGMIRYQTDNNVFEAYNGTAWNILSMSSTGGSFLPLSGGTLTGVVAHPLGSAASPSINFGDTTSGFYSSGAGNLNLATAGTSRMNVSSAGNIGIGTTSTAAQLAVFGTAATSSNNIGTFSALTPSLTADSANAFVGGWSTVTPSSNYNMTATLYGAVNRVAPAAAQTGTISGMNGSTNDIINSALGTINLANGVSGAVTNASSGTITSARGAVVSIANTGSGTITNGYGMYVGNINATNKWSIYAADNTAPNYFGGNVGIGTTAPSAKLQVAGQIVASEYVVATGAVIDFNNGNSQVLQSVGGTAITLSNLVAGGVYNILIEDTTARTYSFTGCTTTYWSPAAGVTSNRSMFTIYRRGTSACYITWSTGFN